MSRVYFHVVVCYCYIVALGLCYRARQLEALYFQQNTQEAPSIFALIVLESLCYCFLYYAFVPRLFAGQKIYISCHLLSAAIAGTLSSQVLSLRCRAGNLMPFGSNGRTMYCRCFLSLWY